jgi:uncharacterized membrane protein
MIVVGVALLAAVLYFVHGSFEMYPTDEQHGKVRLVMSLVIGCLVVAEVLLWGLLRYIRGREQPNSAMDSDTVRSPLRAPHGARHRDR